MVLLRPAVELCKIQGMCFTSLSQKVKSFFKNYISIVAFKVRDGNSQYSA
jgi:hypothetical protein